MNLTKKDKLLLDCLFNNQNCISQLRNLETSEWNALIQLSQKHLLGSFLYQQLKGLKEKIDIPSDVIERLHPTYMHCAARNIKLFHELQKALQSLENSGVPFILLKGAYLNEIVYKDIGLRGMEDADILFKKEDLRRGQTSLLKAGYLTDNDRLSIDVHWYLEQYIDIDMKKVWDMARPVLITGVNALALSPEHLIVHLCTHLSFHHQFQFAALRSFCDIREAINYYHSDIDWDGVISVSEEWGVRNGVYLTLLLAKELTGAKIPQDTIENLKPASFKPEYKEWAIKQIFHQNEDEPSLSPYFWQIRKEKSVLKKISLFLKLMIPTQEFLSQKYPSSINTKFSLHYYMIRMKAHIMRYLSVYWRIMIREESTLRLVKEKNHTFTMMEWISSADSRLHR
jgi:hypothetical protein